MTAIRVSGALSVVTKHILGCVSALNPALTLPGSLRTCRLHGSCKFYADNAVATSPSGSWRFFSFETLGGHWVAFTDDVGSSSSAAERIEQVRA